VIIAPPVWRHRDACRRDAVPPQSSRRRKHRHDCQRILSQRRHRHLLRSRAGRHHHTHSTGRYLARSASQRPPRPIATSTMSAPVRPLQGIGASCSSCRHKDLPNCLGRHPAPDAPGQCAKSGVLIFGITGLCIIPTKSEIRIENNVPHDRMNEPRSSKVSAAVAFMQQHWAVRAHTRCFGATGDNFR
jgi:hypothetical protein